MKSLLQLESLTRPSDRGKHRRTIGRRTISGGRFCDKGEIIKLPVIRTRLTHRASLPAGEAAPKALLCANRGHWGIEIMHRNKDVILDEDGYTNRSDNAPRNIFSLIGFALKILKSVSSSPTRAIEQFQDDWNKALRLFAG